MSGPDHPNEEHYVQGHPLDDTVRAVVAQHLDVPAEHLTVDTSLEELGLDDDTAATVGST